jgi:hypothetical protein
MNLDFISYQQVQDTSTLVYNLVYMLSFLSVSSIFLFRFSHDAGFIEFIKYLNREKRSNSSRLFTLHTRSCLYVM